MSPARPVSTEAAFAAAALYYRYPTARTGSA